MNDMADDDTFRAEAMLRAGDRVLVGSRMVTVGTDFAASLDAGDRVLGVADSGDLKRIPRAVHDLVEAAVADARLAFGAMGNVSPAAVNRFFDCAAGLLADDAVFSAVLAANLRDVESAKTRGRSTTRLELTPTMRADMVEALRMWRDLSLIHI